MARTSVTTSKIQRELQQKKPFATPAAEAGVALLRTSDLLQRRLAATVEPHGITVQQYNVLRILRGAHPEVVPTLEIATRMIEQAPGITRLLDRLEAKKLIERSRCRLDRRRVLCSISKSGLALLATLERPMSGSLAATFAALSDAETRSLIRLLDALRDSLNPESVSPTQNSKEKSK
ncbi:MAG: MarR family transcriptional regulator [Thermoanaerobaculia bacterium]